MEDWNGPIEHVSQDRWERAQQWELGVWRSENRSPGPRDRLARALRRLIGQSPRVVAHDDWNHWWARHFDHYRLVPTELNNVLELGCGPYTNVRLIREGRKIGHLVGSDPHALQYARFPDAWLAQAYRRGEILLDDHPAEDCPFATDYFDLVVMVNVLDHVRDARACLLQALRVVRPGGLLILGQDLTSAEDSARHADDIGHPIRVTHEWLDTIIDDSLERVLYRLLPRQDGRNPEAHYGTYLLIGRKRS